MRPFTSELAPYYNYASHCTCPHYAVHCHIGSPSERHSPFSHACYSACNYSRVQVRIADFLHSYGKILEAEPLAEHICQILYAKTLSTYNQARPHNIYMQPVAQRQLFQLCSSVPCFLKGLR